MKGKEGIEVGYLDKMDKLKKEKDEEIARLEGVI